MEIYFILLFFIGSLTVFNFFIASDYEVEVSKLKKEVKWLKKEVKNLRKNIK